MQDHTAATMILEGTALNGPRGEPTPSPALESAILTSLSAQHPIFRSWGIATLYVTYGKGQEPLAIPIQSIDLSAIQARLLPRKPHAEERRAHIKAGSEEGRAAGLTKDRWISVLEIGAPSFIAATEDYNELLGFYIILEGLGLDLQDVHGETVWQHDGSIRKYAEAIQALKDGGFTTSHFGDLVRQIQGLTRAKNEELEGNSASL